MSKQVLYWHRADLRFHDNECLATAAAAGNKILPVYIYDERHYAMLPLGCRKSSYKRYAYLRDTLAVLRKNYQAAGGDILILFGKPEEIIPLLMAQYNCDTLIYQQEMMSEETSVEAALMQALKNTNCEILPVWGRTMYHKEDIPYEASNIPLTFKTFRVNTAAAAQPRELIATPDTIDFIVAQDYGDLDCEADIGFTADEKKQSYDPLHYPAGEDAALQRLQYYTFDSQLLTGYKWTRNRSLGADYSSKLSPYLAHGSLSPRMVYHQVKFYETEIKRNISTWWLVFEVVWRDYFSFLGLRFGDKVFGAGGYREKETDWKEDYNLFDRWKNAETGVPFVDAHMKELQLTGFMSNRGRVNTSSFLAHDYKVDWRWGAAWFESHLLDYDVCSNWFNWNNQAIHLYYTNPVHQSLKYDKKAEYITATLPYLKNLPIAYRHAPWLLSSEALQKAGAKAYHRPAEIYDKWSRSIKNIEELAEDGGENKRG